MLEAIYHVTGSLFFVTCAICVALAQSSDWREERRKDRERAAATKARR
jgi:hypothetical protein